MTLTTKLEVVDYVAMMMHSIQHPHIVKQVKDNNSIVTTLGDGTIVTTVRIEGDERFLLSITGKVTGSITIKYSSFFGSIRLPVEESTLDRIYDNYEGDPDKTLPGYMFKHLTDVFKLQLAIEGENECAHHSQYKNFYSEIIVPAFLKYQKTNRVELSEEDREKFVKCADPKIGDVRMFPELAGEGSVRDTTQIKRSSSSKPLPEELPKFDDEYELQRRKYYERHLPDRPFAPIGDRDLNPFGQYPPLKPYLGGPEASPHSGMIPDKNHPLFQRGSSPNSGRDDHPPGARYDDPLGQGDFDAIGKGLPGGFGFGRETGGSSFGGNNPFGRSSGFGGGFI